MAVSAGITSSLSSLKADTSAMKTYGKQELSRDDFMTLFITQMQYQDPMKPMDSYEMASQLAQFSSMDATMQMSANMEKLLDYQTSQNNLQLLGLIGNEVVVQGNGIGVNDGVAGTPEFVLDGAADVCMADIYDSAGHLVRSVDMGSLGPGKYKLEWDGMDSSGDAVADAAYFYRIDAMDSSGQDVDVVTHTIGHVTGVDFSAGAAQLTIDNHINAGVGDVLTVM